MDRAPLWMQKASLEWLFRLYKQPSRIRAHDGAAAVCN